MESRGSETRWACRVVGVLGIFVATNALACVGDDPEAGPSTNEGQDGGDGAGPAAAPRIVSFAAEPTKLAFGGGDVKLSFVVEGATSASIDNGVGDVTGKTSVDVKAAQTVTYTLTATNAAGAVTATAKVDVEETFTVAGKLIAGGQPVANAAVFVAGQPATTSNIGTFSAANVKPPYDVAVAVGNPAAITVYRGLTRPDPTLVAFGDSGPLPATARMLESVSGTVTGGTTPYVNPMPLVTISGANRARGIATTTGAGAFTLSDLAIAGPVRWVGPETTILSFHASAVISGIGYYGKHENVPVIDDGVPAAQNIAMNQVQMVDIAWSVTGPATYVDASRTRVAGGVRFTNLGGGYDVVAPSGALPRNGTTKVHEVAGSTFFVEASYNRLAGDEEQTFARKAATASATSSFSVALAEPPRPTSPADAVTNVATGATFAFGALAGGIQRVTFSATAQPTITIFTKETSITLPDTTPFGVSLPKNTLYTWRVFGYAPLASLDDALLADTIDAADGTLPPLVDVRVAAATPRTFTTAP